MAQRIASTPMTLEYSGTRSSSASMSDLASPRAQPAASPGKRPPRNWQVQDERKPADRSDPDSGAGHGVGEVVPAQADDRDGDADSYRVRCCRDQDAQHPAPGRP